MRPTCLLTGARRRSAVAATGVITALLLALVPTARFSTADALGYSSLLDAPSPYEGQTTCTSTPAPGTVALSRWLLRKYPATRSMGLMRACGTGGTSEHKDGRAFDWGADVARATTRHAAYDFITKALATDAAGNPHALARRLGIMYLIYNDTIWSSYRDFAPRPYLNSACTTRATCSRTLRHLNHVHISLGYAGAAAQTSWYRVRNIASRPVLYPGTRELDPDETAVTGFTVPATGAVTSSPFLLRAGVTYRIVVTGTVQDAAGAVAGDATCVPGTDPAILELAPRTPLPTPPAARTGDWGAPSAGSVHPDSPASLPATGTRALLLQDALRWDGGCRPDHTYQAWYTPLLTERLRLAYLDPTATGTFTAYVARDDISLHSLARR